MASPGAYAVSDERGDIGSPGEGLFYRDTRHLSRLVLTVDGARLVSRGASTRGSRAEFSLAAGESGEGLRVTRRRSVGGAMLDEVLFTNEARATVEVVVSVECEADFEDIFAVRGFARTLERGETSEEVLEGALRYAYRRDGFSRGTEVRVFAGGMKPVADRGGSRCASGSVRGRNASCASP